MQVPISKDIQRHAHGQDASKETVQLNAKKPRYNGAFSNDRNLERETRLELATPTLARLCSTN